MILSPKCAAEGNGRRKLKAEVTPLAVYLDNTVADTETELGNVADDVGLGKLQHLPTKRWILATALILPSHAMLQRC